ncbi:MAG: ribonuclease H-like domain-containing protein [Candidatus Melainabacteria bacterium]|nr:ribonuclease H-like domain-containing protein [Candidatus Melainabacteria bacterium]
MTAEVLVKQKPDLYDFDLPDDRLQHYLKKDSLAVDTETRGLNLHRDRLCLVQICDDEGLVSFVRYSDPGQLPTRSAGNLKKLFESPKITKIFHYARFDVTFLKYYLDIDVHPVWCTKIASKLVRTYTDKHSLKYLVSELLGFELDKTNQTSDWAAADLSDSQLEYAANDVRVLIPLKKLLTATLIREQRLELAEKLFKTLPTVCELDRLGYRDIFEH